MKMHAKLIAVAGAAALAVSFNMALAEGKTAPVLVDAVTAEFKEVAPGIKKKVLWGSHDAGPYGAFTRFAPGLSNPLHSHSHEVRIVVIEGAYIYKSQSGSEQRIAAGSYFSVPAGDVHMSGGDAKEGALFYEESPGKFDLNVVDLKKKK